MKATKGWAVAAVVAAVIAGAMPHPRRRHEYAAAHEAAPSPAAANGGCDHPDDDAQYEQNKEAAKSIAVCALVAIRSR